MSQETPMEQMKRFADNQLIIGDRFKITYYSASDKEEIIRIGRWDEKSTFRTSKAGDKLMVYYDEEKQGYRTAKNEWKLEAAEIIKNEKGTKNQEEDKMSENTEELKMNFDTFTETLMEQMGDNEIISGDDLPQELLTILDLMANATYGRNSNPQETPQMTLSNILHANSIDLEVTEDESDSDDDVSDENDEEDKLMKDY